MGVLVKPQADQTDGILRGIDVTPETAGWHTIFRYSTKRLLSTMETWSWSPEATTQWLPFPDVISTTSMLWLALIVRGITRLLPRFIVCFLLRAKLLARSFVHLQWLSDWSRDPRVPIYNVAHRS